MTKSKYVTKKGAEALRAEYRELFHSERPKVVETVAWAASNGDRSENADYIYGKRRLREIDRRIKFITDFLDDATIVDPAEIISSSVVFGATVDLIDEKGDQRTYRIVSDVEMDVSQGDISYRSPVGRALIGKSVDDEVYVKTPKGEKEFTVVGIRYKK